MFRPWKLRISLTCSILSIRLALRQIVTVFCCLPKIVHLWQQWKKMTYFRCDHSKKTLRKRFTSEKEACNKTPIWWPFLSETLRGGKMVAEYPPTLNATWLSSIVAWNEKLHLQDSVCIWYASHCICFSMIHLLKQIIAGAHNPVSRDQGANIYHLHMDMNMCNVSMEQVSLCACKYHIVSTTKTRKRSSNQKTKAPFKYSRDV